MRIRVFGELHISGCLCGAPVFLCMSLRFEVYQSVHRTPYLDLILDRVKVCTLVYDV